MVYFVKCNFTNETLMKVGYTIKPDIHQRIKSMQTGCPVEIEEKDTISFIDFIPDKNAAEKLERKLEKAIHRYLKEFKSNGEWFYLFEQNPKYVALFELLENLYFSEYDSYTVDSETDEFGALSDYCDNDELREIIEIFYEVESLYDFKHLEESRGFSEFEQIHKEKITELRSRGLYG